MNVLFVSTDYPRRGEPASGFPNYLYRVSLSLIQLGHRPIILAPGGWDGHRTERGIEIFTVRVSTYKNCQSQTLNYALTALRTGSTLNRKIKELSEKHHIDIIQFTSLYGIAMLYHGKIPAVLRLSSYAKTAFGSYQSHTPATVKTMAFFEVASSRRCNAVFSPCQRNADAFGRDCHRDVKVIETPFVNDVREYDTEFYDTWLHGKKYVLFFGALYAEKGIFVIAEILEKFLENNPEYHFVFIGDASNINGRNAAQILQQKAGKQADKLIFSGAMGHRQLYPAIRGADFVVLPSFMENLSNACIEAMYFERVVIGTDGASFEQLITHGRNGLLCRIGDSYDLLEKMQIAASMSESGKKRMGKLAGRRIDKLKPEYAVRKLVRLYEHVIAGSKGR